MDTIALLKKLQNREVPIGVVGLGYVGLPLAVHMAHAFEVIGFDINAARIEALRAGHDATGEVEDAELAAAKIRFTAEPSDLAACRFIIVAVPTPIDAARIPDLGPVRAASKTVGGVLESGTVVVYESTVYPGVTDEVCAPILASTSGLTRGTDFFLGYSPERINPGDKVHTFDKIVKVVSGESEPITDLIAEVYGAVVSAGIFRAADIRTAEAAKVIENTQRDLNIALMNELALIFDRLGIDTHDVLEAAGTKWNFLGFKPGLVGGHCIGVDPYYLTYLAQRIGHHPRVILSGRRINDAMGKFVAERTIKEMIRAHQEIAGARVLVMGLTFKENVPDLRNSKVFDVVRELREYEVEVLLHDPMISTEELAEEYNERAVSLDEIGPVDAVVLAVGHRAYLEMGIDALCDLAKPDTVMIDVKGVLDREAVTTRGLRYWRL